MAEDATAAIEGEVFRSLSSSSDTVKAEDGASGLFVADDDGSDLSDTSRETGGTTTSIGERIQCAECKCSQCPQCHWERCNCQCRCLDSMYTEKVWLTFQHFFSRYGTFVGNYPLLFVAIPIFVLGGMGMGLFYMDTETDIEYVYYPKNSPTFKDRDKVRALFKDYSSTLFNRFSLSDPTLDLSLIFTSKSNKSLLKPEPLREIRDVFNRTRFLTMLVGKETNQLDTWCVQVGFDCVIDGGFLLRDDFLEELTNESVTYPIWIDGGGKRVDMSRILAKVVAVDGVLVSAEVVRIALMTTYLTDAAQSTFHDFASRLSLKYSTVTHAFPNSMKEELGRSSGGEVALASASISLCWAYSCAVSLGGNPVSTRFFLGIAGILAAVLSIIGSMGMLSAAGVKMISYIGVIPFLIIGIGIDDMFLLMSSYSGSLGSTELTVPQRIGACMSHAGVGITITSFTDALAFAIGATSAFRSIMYFSIYAAVAVTFCYLANITMFIGCLTYHGRRVSDMRHFLTCRPTETREQLRSMNNNFCVALCCGGSIPDRDHGDESICERIPNTLLPLLVYKKVVCVVIVACFMGYLGTCIYGVVNLHQGMLLQHLVRIHSYYYTYLVNVYDNFPESVPIGFIVDKPINYAGAQGQQFLKLMDEARNDSLVFTDFQRCWFAEYISFIEARSTLPTNDNVMDSNPLSGSNTSSASNISSETLLNASYSTTTTPSSPFDPSNFIKNVKEFLDKFDKFKPDVVFDKGHQVIKASRCFLLSEKTRDVHALAHMMERLRELAGRSSLPVFVFHYTFGSYDQVLEILPATLKVLGCAVLSMTVVTSLFLPHLCMVLLVVLTIVMILTGIMGCMYYAGISLSAMTMTHLVITVGFSVDFSTHVCAAYLMSDKFDHHERAVDAVRHASSPIMHGAISSLIAVFLLAFSDSYLYLTFFKIMLMVIVLGVLHAVLFLPAVLSLIGPNRRAAPE